MLAFLVSFNFISFESWREPIRELSMAVILNLLPTDDADHICNSKYGTVSPQVALDFSEFVTDKPTLLTENPSVPGSFCCLLKS